MWSLARKRPTTVCTLYPSALTTKPRHNVHTHTHKLGTNTCTHAQTPTLTPTHPHAHIYATLFHSIPPFVLSLPRACVWLQYHTPSRPSPAPAERSGERAAPAAGDLQPWIVRAALVSQQCMVTWCTPAETSGARAASATGGSQQANCCKIEQVVFVWAVYKWPNSACRHTVIEGSGIYRGKERLLAPGTVKTTHCL